MMKGGGTDITASGPLWGWSGGSLSAPFIQTGALSHCSTARVIITLPMPLAPGTRFGPYEILSPLGSGGMGEVYRAQDTRLERSVAIKILPTHLCGDATRRQRFEREAKTISSLNHPNICVVHDVGHQDGVDYLVMECIEGETLTQRLKKGPLPQEQVLKYGAQIADALDKAHRGGVVHRDLKPGNIMLTRMGAKLLDFGLAKPLQMGQATTLTALTTAVKVHGSDAGGLTEEGAILGTLRYMSPEQLDGQEADERSDIFALGAVLYEMATGRCAFGGKSLTSMIAAILEREPQPITHIQPMSSPALDRLVKQCLTKDREERLQSAHDVKLQLESIGEASAQSGVAGPAAGQKKIEQVAAWAVAVVGLLAAIVFWAAYFLRAPKPGRMSRSSLLPPAGTSNKSYNFAVSPDGTRLAFVATGLDGNDSLWVRTLSASNAQPLEGTRAAMFPFWSPDNQRVGFFAEGKLKVVDSTSSTVRILCDARYGRGGTWNRNGTIVFAPDINGPLSRIADSGGSAERLTEIPRSDSGQGHRWPYFLPDGKRFLFFMDWSAPEDPQVNGIYAGSLDGGAPKLISSDLGGNVAFASGSLLYVRDRSLMAQPFDPSRLEFTGPAVAIAEQEVTTDIGFSQSGFTVSETGVLVFESATDTRTYLTWFDPAGKELGQLPANGYGEPRISPDGRFVAFDSDDDRNGKSYIRIYDFVRSISTRLTDGGNEMDASWSPDGKRITYIVGFRAGSSIYEVPVNRSGPSQLLLKGGKMIHIDWSPDRHMVFTGFAKGRAGLSVYSARDNSVSDLGVFGAEGRFSPNGRWIVSNGVYVMPYPGPGGRIQLSEGFGSQPVWSRDGRQLFFIAPDKTMMTVGFDPQTGRAGTPRAIFKTRVVAASFVSTQYDVAPDGRFLIHALPADHASPLTLLTNWTAALKQ